MNILIKFFIRAFNFFICILKRKKANQPKNFFAYVNIRSIKSKEKYEIKRNKANQQA